MKDWNLPKPATRHRVTVSRGQAFILDPNGERVWGPGDPPLAERKCDLLNAALDASAKRGERACLCCGAPFESEGIHHRMCSRCRAVSDPLAGYGLTGSSGGRKARRAAGV